MERIKKNDVVRVISGKDEGKQGAVIEIDPKKGKVKVKDIALAVHYLKPTRKGGASGIKRKETFLDLSKVMPFCLSCKKPTRVNVKISENNIKVRVCNRCKEVF